MIKTDQVTYLEMLAIIALTEAEDNKGDVGTIISHLDKIATKDLHKILKAIAHPVIESLIIGALANRNDADGDELTSLVAVKKDHRVQRDLCNAAATVYLRTYRTPSKEQLKALFIASTPAVYEVAARILAGVPKGELPKFLPDTAMCFSELVMDEFKERNDPVGENLPDMLNLPHLSQGSRIAILDTLRNDPRVTLDYLLTLGDNKLALSLVWDRAKEMPIVDQIVIYSDARQEEIQDAILHSLGERPQEDLESIEVELLMERAKTASVQKTLLRIFGTRLPIQRLLELRTLTIDEKASAAFKSIFKARGEELLEFLTAP